MALAFLLSAPFSTLTRLSRRTTTISVGRFSQSTQCMIATAPKFDGTAVTIADKPPPPPTLEDSYIQSITSKYVVCNYIRCQFLILRSFLPHNWNQRISVTFQFKITTYALSYCEFIIYNLKMEFIFYNKK